MPPNKYAKRADKAAKKQARRAQEEALSRSDKGDYRVPGADECEVDPPIEEAPSDTTRLYFFLSYADGRIVNIVGLHFVRLGPGEDGWYNLARVDCSHGHLHLHFDDEGVRQKNVTHLCRLDIIDDVEHGYDEAYSAIFDRWSEHERRIGDELQHPNRRRPTQRLPQAGPPPDCEQGD